MVALNQARIAEEAAGTARQASLIPGDISIPSAERRWPQDDNAQLVALCGALRAAPLAHGDIARRFKGASRGDRLPRILQTLVALG